MGAEGHYPVTGLERSCGHFATLDRDWIRGRRTSVGILGSQRVGGQFKSFAAFGISGMAGDWK